MHRLLQHATSYAYPRLASPAAHGPRPPQCPFQPGGPVQRLVVDNGRGMNECEISTSLEIADGYHRVCAPELADENTPLPCHLVSQQAWWAHRC